MPFGRGLRKRAQKIFPYRAAPEMALLNGLTHFLGFDRGCGLALPLRRRCGKSTFVLSGPYGEKSVEDDVNHDVRHAWQRVHKRQPFGAEH